MSRSVTLTRADLIPPGSPSAGPLAVLGRELEVPVAGGGSVRHVHLDYAASAPAATVAAAAVTELLPWAASVHRGAGPLSARCSERYEQARDQVGRFLGTRPGDQVVFTRNTTDALNLLARVVPAATTTVVFATEHHAALLPWRRVVRLPAPTSPTAAVAGLAAGLVELRRAGPAGGGTDPLLVAVTGASNVTGELWPVADLVRVAHRFGARVVLDAAQLAAHRPVDVAALDVDYVVLSGHKLYAPFGTGVLAGRADWLDTAQPYLVGGGATAHVGDATNDVRWRSGPARHEGGSPNLLGAVALGTVCAALGAADRADLVAREDRLLDRLRTGLAAVPGVRQYSLFGPDQPRVGIVVFTVAGQNAERVAARLAAEYGISVRSGLFCAHPLTRRLAGGDAVRASLGLGTSAADVDRLVAAVRELAGGPGGTPS